ILLHAMPPVVCHAGSTYEADLPIDDDEFPVRPVIRSWPVVPANRVIPAHMSTRLFQPIEEFFRSGETAYRIQHEVHLHSCSCSFCKGVHDPLRDVTFFENVSFPVDALLRSRNRF